MDAFLKDYLLKKYNLGVTPSLDVSPADMWQASLNQPEVSTGPIQMPQPPAPEIPVPIEEPSREPAARSVFDPASGQLTDEEMARYGIRTNEQLEALKAKRAAQAQQLIGEAQDNAFAKQMMSHLDRVGGYQGSVRNSAPAQAAMDEAFKVKQQQLQNVNAMEDKLGETQYNRLKDIDLSRARMAAISEASAAKREDQRIARESNELFREQMRKDKLAKEARLSDKQVEHVNDFDNSMATAKDLLPMLGKHDNWVGPVDSKIPTMMVGADQASFRAAVGRVNDMYRRLITGAAAADKELSRIETRLPKISDTPDQFKIKTIDFIKEVEKAKQRYLQNLQRKQKDISEFDASGAKERRLVNGVVFEKTDGGWKRIN